MIDVDTLIPEINEDSFNFNSWINRLNEIDKRVKDNKISWQDFSETLDDNEKCIAKWGEETQGSIRTQNNLQQANEAARASIIAHNKAIQQQTLSFKASQAVLKTLSIAGNMLAMWLVSVAIEGVVTDLDNLIHRTEKSKEKIDEANGKYEESKSKLETLNSELSTTSQRIDELNSKENLTFTKQAELENLKAQNAELQNIKTKTTE